MPTLLLHSMGDLRMNKENREPLRKRKLPNPQLLGLLMGVVALVAPAVFSYIPSYRFPVLHISAVMWTLSFYATEWRFTVTNFLALLLYMDLMNVFGVWIIGIRILFAYQTMRYFQGKTTRKRLIALGIIAELPFAPLLLWDILHSIILNAMGVQTSFGFTSPIPIPCMLVVGILLFRYFPTPSKTDWDLERETEKKWVETGPDSTNA